MSNDAQNDDLALTADEKEKFGELVALLARHGFGAAGPPRETTFAQIERFGHQAGQMVARAIDARLAEQHVAHFAGEQPCPTCGEKHLPRFSISCVPSNISTKRRSAHDDAERRWTDYLRWGRACWGGNVLQVIAELREHQRQVGLPPKDCEKTDPRKVLADAVGYFQHNVSRMDYPAYRRQGLPTTSMHMESLVKEINARVKGTEKFWNDGASGEAILQIRPPPSVTTTA